MPTSNITVEDPSHSQLTAIERCPECRCRPRTEGGETYCPECGLVIQADYLDRGPEWRRFEGEIETRRRVGLPVTPSRHDRGLSTEIGHDHVTSGRKRFRMSRLRREHARSKFASKSERNLADALGQIARMAAALDLPFSVRERASAIYRDARRANLISGRSIDRLTAASVYAACRCGVVVRTLGEVAEVAQCSQDELEAGYRLLNRQFGLAAPIVDLKAFVSRIGSAVDAPDRVRIRAFELVSRAEDAGLQTGRHPGGLAAACVYFAGHTNGQLYTQAELAEAADISVVTLRKRWYELREIAD